MELQMCRYRTAHQSETVGRMAELMWGTAFWKEFGLRGLRACFIWPCTVVVKKEMLGPDRMTKNSRQPLPIVDAPAEAVYLALHCGGEKKNCSAPDV